MTSEISILPTLIFDSLFPSQDRKDPKPEDVLADLQLNLRLLHNTLHSARQQHVVFILF